MTSGGIPCSAAFGSTEATLSVSLPKLRDFAGHLQRDVELSRVLVVGGSFVEFCLARVMKNSSWCHRRCQGVFRDLVVGGSFAGLCVVGVMKNKFLVTFVMSCGLGFSVDEVRTPVDGLLEFRVPGCKWILPTAPVILHVPRLSVVSSAVSLRCSVLSRARVRVSCWAFSATQAVVRSRCWLRVAGRGSLASCTPSTYVCADFDWCFFFGPVHRAGAVSTGTRSHN